jgi:hypothetical protein
MPSRWQGSGAEAIPQGELIHILALFLPLKKDSAVSALRTVSRTEARIENTFSYGFSSDY